MKRDDSFQRYDSKLMCLQILQFNMKFQGSIEIAKPNLATTHKPACNPRIFHLNYTMRICIWLVYGMVAFESRLSYVSATTDDSNHIDILLLRIL